MPYSNLETGPYRSCFYLKRLVSSHAPLLRAWVTLLCFLPQIWKFTTLQTHAKFGDWKCLDGVAPAPPFCLFFLNAHSCCEILSENCQVTSNKNRNFLVPIPVSRDLNMLNPWTSKISSPSHPWTAGKTLTHFKIIFMTPFIYKTT